MIDDPTERVALVCRPAGPARIELYRNDELVGDCDLHACPACRLAVLEQLRIDPAHRRRGLATTSARAWGREEHPNES